MRSRGRRICHQSAMQVRRRKEGRTLRSPELQDPSARKGEMSMTAHHSQGPSDEGRRRRCQGGPGPAAAPSGSRDAGDDRAASPGMFTKWKWSTLRNRPYRSAKKISEGPCPCHRRRQKQSNRGSGPSRQYPDHRPDHTPRNTTGNYPASVVAKTGSERAEDFILPFHNPLGKGKNPTGRGILTALGKTISETEGHRAVQRGG